MTVRMIRDPEQYPEPHTADIHPDEVENAKAGGWQITETPAPKRTRKAKEA